MTPTPARLEAQERFWARRPSPQGGGIRKSRDHFATPSNIAREYLLNPLRDMPNSHLLYPTRGRGEIAVAEAGLDDVFIDDITFPAVDDYALGATLFLPRGAKQHAVLINSATAVPRKIYRKFAGYLAGRGFAVLTYDYRGIGDSRQRALEGYYRPKSLVGFKAD